MSEETNEMNKSKFTGTLLGMIGIQILIAAMMVFTLGLAAPFAVCIWQDWKSKHTVLDGKQLVFDGNGANLFMNYIKWWLLMVVTFGIYGFWVPIKFQQWVTEHTHLK